MYRVAIVDDEEIFLDFMEQAIDWAGYQCRIIGRLSDGESALQFILEESPDIVFIDICMPGVDGLEVCKWVQECRKNTVLIVTTAHDEFSFLYKAFKLRLQDYLLKPFSGKELEAVLQGAIALLEAQESAPGGRAQGGKGMDLIDRINLYIECHYQENNFTIGRLARELKYENSYLRRVYKRRTGMTIAQKLDEVRMEKAKELLREGHLFNKDIALAVGYSDPYYFSKRFKQLSGETPTSFRGEQGDGQDRPGGEDEA